MKRSLKLIFFTALLAFFISFGISYFHSVSLIEETTILHKSYKFDSLDLEFSSAKFKLYIYSSGIKFPSIVYRQALLESGRFSSRVWYELNNPFGFYYKGKYKKFKDWKHSVRYYKAWQFRHYKGGDYYEFLDGFYAEDPEYINKLKQMND